VKIHRVFGFGLLISGLSWAQVNPYLQTPTSSSIYISWHASISTESRINYGTTPTLGQFTTGTNFQFNATTWWHTVKLTGLSPNTEYYYQAVSGSATSPVLRFRTQPPDNLSTGHIRFLAYGDNRTSFTDHSRVIAGMMATVQNIYGSPDYQNSINVVLNAGDIVTTGTTLSQYVSEYFNPIAPLSASVPFMVAIGNHEVEAANYYNYMEYGDPGIAGTEGEKYYSFRIGPVLFVCINSNTMGATQITWLTNLLTAAQANSSIKWVFVNGHHPGHSEIWPDGNWAWVQNSVIPLLATYPKVELYMYGHSHNYERGAWMTGNMRLLLTGGGGGALDRWGMYPNQADYQEIQRSHDIFTYSLFDIDVGNGSYTVRSYGLGNSNLVQNNALIDTWCGKLGTPGPRTPVSLAASGLNPVRLTVSPFVSDTTIMSSQFQITTTPGNYAAPLVNSLRDWENVYGVTGGTTPVDLNAGIDLSRYSAAALASTTTYYWRARYRDQFMKWSAWSQEQSFRPVAVANTANFVADTLNVDVGSTVRFTDLSTNAPTAWDWDLDGNGSVDRTIRDPVWVYTQPGQYTVTLTAVYGATRLPVTKTAYINVRSVTKLQARGPNRATLNQARFFPSPFRNFTVLKLDLQTAEDIRIDLYTIEGIHVRSLSSGMKPVGKTYVTWDGKDGAGRALPNGKYFYQIRSPSLYQTRDIILLR